MNILRLFFPGEYEDAFVYMGRLLLFTTSRSIQTISLQVLTEKLQTEFPQSRFAIEMAILRNDWLTSPAFIGISKDAGLSKAIRQQFLNISSGPIEILTQDKFEQTLALESRALLDILIYYRRIYLAADDGFYHIDGIWDNGMIPKLERLTRRHDARSFALSARLGTICVSCGDEGLFSSFDEFGWADVHRNGMSKTADMSLSTSWISFNLVNYRSRKDIEFFASHRTPTSNRQIERKVVASFTSLSPDLNAAVDDDAEDYDIASAFFFDKNAFQQDSAGRLLKVDLKLSNREGRLPRAKDRYVLNEQNDRILAIRPCAIGPILEMQASVVLLTTAGVPHLLINERVLNVRTFKDSKHYQNLTCITTEEGVYLISCVDLSSDDNLASDESDSTEGDNWLFDLGLPRKQKQRFQVKKTK